MSDLIGWFAIGSSVALVVWGFRLLRPLTDDERKTEWRGDV